MMTITRSVLSLVLLILCASCTTHVGKFALGTTGIWKGNPEEFTTALNSEKPVTGESCSRYVLFIPISSATIGKAYDDAVKTVPGTQALVDAKVMDHDKFISLLYNVSCFKVSGKPVAFKKVATR